MKRTPDLTKVSPLSGIVVWIDVDGVLVDFKKMFNQVLARDYGIYLPENYTPKDWSWVEILGSSDAFVKIFKTLPESWPEYLEMLPKADHFTKTLKQLGCRVVMITDIPSTMVPYRLKNLTTNNIYFDEIYFTNGRKKTDFALPLLERFKNEMGSPPRNFFVDDRALNIQDFLENMPNMELAVTMNYPYNSKEVPVLQGKYDARMFNADSNFQTEMYEKVISRILEIRAYENEKARLTLGSQIRR